MKVLLVGNNIGYLQQLAGGLDLKKGSYEIVQTERELRMLQEPSVNFDLVLLDTFIISTGGGQVISDRAIKLLRSNGYEGVIGACTPNPIINSYLANRCGASFGCGDYDGDWQNCPELTLDQIVQITRRAAGL